MPSFRGEHHREVTAAALEALERPGRLIVREADSLLREFKVARVAADPALTAAAAQPAGWPGLVYFRLHGSPRRYYSAYSEKYLTALAENLHHLSAAATVWCIFDNTASGAALANALELIALGR